MSVYFGKLVEKKNGPWRFKTLFGFLQILSLLLLQEEKFENSVFITLNWFSEVVIYPYQIYHHHYTKTMAMSFISLTCDWNCYTWYHWLLLLSTIFCELEPDYWHFILDNSKLSMQSPPSSVAFQSSPKLVKAWNDFLMYLTDTWIQKMNHHSWIMHAFMLWFHSEITSFKNCNIGQTKHMFPCFYEITSERVRS